MSSTSAQSHKHLQSTRLKQKSIYWSVEVLNDDETPFAFVIALLMTLFAFSEQTAQVITYRIHTSGSARIGKFTKTEALEKRAKLIQLARSAGHPLRATVVKEGNHAES